MAQSSLECANIALTKLGAPQITTLGDSIETAIACNLVIDPLKKSLLRMHPWNFAIKRDDLTPTIVNYVEVADGFDRAFITAPAHGFSTGDWVFIWDETEAPFVNGKWQITKFDNDSFYLDDSDFSGSIVTGDGFMTLSQPPEEGYNFLQPLPSDFLRLLQVYPDNADYRLEGSNVCTDEENPTIRYIYNVTDYTKMDVEFYNLLSTGLAAEVCYRITQSSQKELELKDAFKKLLAKARFEDATENPHDELVADEWINSRNAGTGLFTTFWTR